MVSEILLLKTNRWTKNALSLAGSRATPKRTFTQVDTENGGNATDSRSNSSVGGTRTQNFTENIDNAEDLHDDSSIGEYSYVKAIARIKFKILRCSFTR